MTHRLVKGQTIGWPSTGVRVEVTGHPCDLSALLVDERDQVGSSDDLVFYNQPRATGLSWSPGPVQRLDVDLERLVADRVLCVASIDPDSPVMGGLPAMRALLSDPDGTPVAEFLLTGLTGERAVIVCEVYRRSGRWKVRAVAQGYDGGLAVVFTRHGVAVDDPPPPVSFAPAHRIPSTGIAAPSPPPPGTSDQDRLYQQAAGIFEDAARSAASLRSSVDYADHRRETALSAAVSDPRGRTDPGVRPLHDTAQRRYDELVGTARANHRRDVDQLKDELRLLEERLPASMAPWTARAWSPWRPPRERSAALRVGDLHVPEAPDLRLPMLLRIPVGQALWVDTANDDGSGRLLLRSLLTRLVAAHPAGGLTLTVIDLTGAAASALSPLGRPGCRVLTQPPVTTPAAAADTLQHLVHRVDLVQMARRAGALDALGDDSGDRLVVLQDVPYGMDDAAVAHLHYLVDEGPVAGVQLLVTGDHGSALERGPLVSSLFRGFVRLPVRPDDHIADGWTGTGWTYTPDLGPDDPRTLDAVLQQASGGADHA